MTLSRFSYVEYDTQAAKEQNALRDQFKKFERDLKTGDISSVDGLRIPQNAYTQEATTCHDNVLRYSAEDLAHSLSELECLYFLLGKDIRIRCMERRGIPHEDGSGEDGKAI